MDSESPRAFKELGVSFYGISPCPRYEGEFRKNSCKPTSQQDANSPQNPNHPLALLIQNQLFPDEIRSHWPKNPCALVCTLLQPRTASTDSRRGHLPIRAMWPSSLMEAKKQQSQVSVLHLSESSAVQQQNAEPRQSDSFRRGPNRANLRTKLPLENLRTKKEKADSASFFFSDYKSIFQSYCVQNLGLNCGRSSVFSPSIVGLNENEPTHFELWSSTTDLRHTVDGKTERLNTRRHARSIHLNSSNSRRACC